MSKNRRKRRTYIDAGDGIALAISTRGPLDPRTAEALAELARAAAARMEQDDPPRFGGGVLGTPIGPQG